MYDSTTRTSDTTNSGDAPPRVKRLFRNLALQDLAAVGLPLYMVLRVLAADDGADAHVARQANGALLAVTLFVLVLTRGELIPAGFYRSLTYGVGLFAPMVLSYFALRSSLASLKPHLLDAQLYQIDRALFGETPALIFDRFVAPNTVEWFAFFYYGYFFVVGTYLVGTLIFDTGPRRYELLLGAAIVVAVGHTLYTLVPGIGPHGYLEARFQHPLIGGAWWGRVTRAVDSGGAELDIFPSLHTALPVLFLFHAIRHRRSSPYKQTLVPLVIVVANIVIATMFLRWHYAIDVIAGISLAGLAQGIGILAWRAEGARAEPARQPVWEPLAPAHMEPADFNRLTALFLIQLAAIFVAASLGAP